MRDVFLLVDVVQGMAYGQHELTHNALANAGLFLRVTGDQLSDRGSIDEL